MEIIVQKKSKFLYASFVFLGASRHATYKPASSGKKKNEVIGLRDTGWERRV